MERQSGIRSALSVLLTVLTVGLTLAVVGKTASIAPPEAPAVFDVRVDPEGQYVDIVFEKPLLGIAPQSVATIRPGVNGIWRWETANVLRFSPEKGFQSGTAYDVALKRGGPVVRVKIEALSVEQFIARKERSADGRTVVLRGEIHFNYPVDPAQLVAHAAVIDGAEQLSIEILDSSAANVITFRTPPMRKLAAARTVKLVIAKTLADSWKGTRLQSQYTAKIKV